MRTALLLAVVLGLSPQPPRTEEPDPKARPRPPIDIEVEAPRPGSPEVRPPSPPPRPDTTVRTADPSPPPPPPGVLVVAGRELPTRISPWDARSDADRWAVQLVYEPLVRAIPDGELGCRIEPALATPVGRGSGRTFTLDPDAVWLHPDGSTSPVLAVDVMATVERLRSDWFADPFTDAPRRVRLHLARPHPDPLMRMTFPLTPHQIEPTLLAERPVGSGPFRHRGRIQDKGRSYLVFEANPHYGRREGMANRPPFKEVRFLAGVDPVHDFRRGGADLALGVTTPDLAGLMASAPQREVPMPAAARLESGLGATARVVTRPTRRIHYLAFNPAKVAFRGPRGRSVRRALMFAVGRGEILDAVYRGGFAEFHRPLSGPFPPGTWPCPPDAAGLDDPALARAEWKAAGIGPLKLTLKYPSAEPLADRAVTELVRQFAELSDEIRLAPLPLSADEFERQVLREKDFDLAWRTFDFADDWFDPAGLFESPSGRLADWLARARSAIGFEDRRSAMAALHRECRDEAPLLPLWNLDMHIVLRRKLRTDPGPDRLDPEQLFAHIDRWRFE